MATKARAKQAKGKAKGKARGRYIRHRGSASPRGDPTPVLGRAAARRAAYLARPGSTLECAACGHRRHVPDDMLPTKVVKCDAPKVKLPSGQIIHCQSGTNVRSWRRGAILEPDLAAARHVAMENIVLETHAQLDAGQIEDGEFWDTVRAGMRTVAA